MSSNTKNLMILGVLVVAIFLVYFFFLRNPSPDASLVSSSNTSGDTSGADSSANENFIAALLNVKNIKLDDTIFSDPAFTSLHETKIDLTPEAGGGGRSNPFAPLGSDSVNTSSGGSTPTPPPATPSR